MRRHRILAFFLGLCLLFASACAEGLSLTGTWRADKFLSLPIRGKLSVALESLVPFGEERCAQLNALLRHVTIDLHTQPAGEGVWEKLSVLVDGAQAIWLNRRAEADGSVRLICSADPDTTYITRDPSGAALLLGSEADASTLVPEEALAALERSGWLDDAAEALKQLPEALAPWSKTARISSEIREIGDASRRMTATVPGDDAAALQELIAGIFGGLLPEGLTFSGRQSVQLYFSEDGEIIKLTWDGRVGWGEEGLRRLDLDWRLCRRDGRVIDIITLSSPAVKGTDRDTFSLSRYLIARGDGTVTLSFKLNDDYVRDGKKTVWKASAELTSAEEEGASNLSGAVALSCTRSDQSRSWSYTPALELDASASLSLSGSIGIAYTENKAEQLRATLSLSLINTDTFDWMLTGQSVDLDAISPGSMERTRSNLIRSLSAQLTAPLVLLPDEDVLFLSEGIDPAVWQRIREAAAAQLNSIPLP